MHQEQNTHWSHKDIQRLINCVSSLLHAGSLTVPLDEFQEDWTNLDKFLQKPNGSSVKKFCNLLRKSKEESAESSWTFLDSMKQFKWFELRQTPRSKEFSDISDDESFFLKSSISNISQTSRDECSPTLKFDDPDVMFLMHLVPELKSLNPLLKSFLKSEILFLLHKLKYETEANP